MKRLGVWRPPWAALVVGAFCVVACAPEQATADTYYFSRITNNGNDPLINTQLKVDVTKVGSSQVLFTFTNDVGVASSITDIYFDDGTLLGIASISSSAGVSFDDPATPGDLPGGNLASPPFETTKNFSADSNSPVSANGVNAVGESVGILFDLINLQTFDDTIAALNAGVINGAAPGNLRIGLHVQAIGSKGGSESYINVGTTPPNTPPIVPEPGTILGALFSLIPVGFIVRRRRAS